MRAPHLTRFLNERKRKAVGSANDTTSEGSAAGGVKRRAKDPTNDEAAPDSSMINDSMQNKEYLSGIESEEDAFSDVADGKKRAADSAISDYKSDRAEDSRNDSSLGALNSDLSPLTQQRLTAMTLPERPDSTDHRTFLASMLQQHARFVADTCRTFQSDPVVLQTVIKSHQHCLDSLLDLYYKMHTRDSSAEQTSALFQENYKMLQRLHEHASHSKTTTAASASTMNHSRPVPSSRMQQLNSRPVEARKGDGSRRIETVPKHKSTRQQSTLTDQDSLFCQPVSTQFPLMGRKKPPPFTTDSLSTGYSSGQAKERAQALDRPQEPVRRKPTNSNPPSLLTQAARASTDDMDVQQSDESHSKAVAVSEEASATSSMQPPPNPREAKPAPKKPAKRNDQGGSRRQESGAARDIPQTNKQGETVRDISSSSAASPPNNPAPSSDMATSVATATATNKENDPSLNVQSTPSTKTAGSSSKPRSDVWACSECTLENSPSKRRCDVCQARRPVLPTTSLLELPKRTPKSRRKKQEYWQDESQILFGDSQPKMPSTRTTKATTTSPAKNMVPDAGTSTIGEAASAATKRPSAVNTEGTNMEATRRITLDQGPDSGPNDQLQEMEVELSPSFKSQETEDPTLPPKETRQQKEVTEPTGSPKSSSASPAKSAAPKDLKASGKTAAIHNPYNAPWQSNAASRRFDRELEEATAQANLARKGPVRTAGAAPEWYTAAKRRPSKKKSDNSDLWDDDDDSEPEEEPYHEVVRGKARKDLPTHDCPECSRFYNAMIIDSQSMDIRQFCRHRSRFGPPPETPEDFWEVDFIDELREKRKVEAVERQAAAAAAAAARRK